MGIGAGIFLLAVGAILTFAVHASVSGISISTIGVILMVAGGFGLLIDLAIFAPRRRMVSERTDSYSAYPAGPPVARQTTYQRDVV